MDKLKVTFHSPLFAMVVGIWLSLFVMPYFQPSAAAESLCAEVKIAVAQELTLERQAFEARLRILNGLAHITLEDIAVDVTFTDAEGISVIASSDPDDTQASFFIRIDSMENIDALDGTGQVEPSSAADIRWLIIPSPGASQGNANGTLYYVGATLTYTIGGEEHTTTVTPDYIYVKPMPELALNYFLTKDVFGDDAWTTTIEPSEVFSLGLRINNFGTGVAREIKIDSAQPKIVSNDQGVLIGFVIESTEVNGAPATKSLLADFGTISPNACGTARWNMTCSLSGSFTQFDADITHSDELGGELTSLIKQADIHTHFLIRDVLVDLPGRDGIRDFLALKDKSDTDFWVYESENTQTAVTDHSEAANLGGPANNSYALNMPVTAGFVFAQLTDPHNGTMAISQVVRSDGKIIKPDNCWLSKTRKENPADGWKYHINLFDANTPGNYTVSFKAAAPTAQAPVLQFISDRRSAEGSAVSFTVTASDPDGSIPKLSAAALPAGAAFTDLGDGTGQFGWTPVVGQAGSYMLTFKASDATLQDMQDVRLTICPADDTDCDNLPDDWEMEHFNSLDRDGLGDYDEDGIPDLEEYRLGANPNREDHQPSVPVILSDEETDQLSPEITIENSSDSDGDTLFYTFELFADVQLSQRIATADVAETPETTTWTVPETLNDNTRYYIRVQASDSVAKSIWAYGAVFVNTANDPPAPFLISYPANQREVDNINPVISVTNSQDHDGDTLSYGFEIYTDEGMSDLVTSATGISQDSSGTTGWQVDPALTDGITYYVRATATDEHGTTTSTVLQTFTVDTANTAPQPPVIAFPTDGGETTQQNIVLTVVNGSDADGEMLTYHFELDTIETFDSPNRLSSGEIPETTDTTGFQVTDLSDNTRYFWRVKTDDGRAQSHWTQGSFLVNTVNDRPETVQLKNPGNNAWTETVQPLLTAAPAGDADHDTLTYHFEVYADAALSQPVHQSGVTEPEYQLSSELSDNTGYYWRVLVEDEHGEASDWSETAFFFVRETEKPQDVSITVHTDENQPLSGLNVYAFSGTVYTGLNAVTSESGTALFAAQNFTQGNYRFRVDYMGGQYWTDTEPIPGTYTFDFTIETAQVGITAMTAAGPAADTKVYLFTENGVYLNLSGTTDAGGKMTFDLPVDMVVKIRADIMGNKYWSDPVTVASGDVTQANVDAGGGEMTVTVKTDSEFPLENLPVYLFNTTGAYLNTNQATGEGGAVSFDVPAGNYKVRVNYMGAYFWSTDTLVNQDTAATVIIDHQDLTVDVNRMFQNDADPLEGISVYLFNTAGNYLNLSQKTDAAGQTLFYLPTIPFKVRADYLGMQFWSDEFTAEDTGVIIPAGEAEVIVTGLEQPIEDATVYAFTDTDVYLYQNGVTDSEGKIVFRLPADRAYTFRANYQGLEYWSESHTLTADIVTPVAIDTGGGAFSFTVWDNGSQPLAGATCFVFTQSGAYLNKNAVTNSQGQVTFDLLNGSYQIRTDYMGLQQYSGIYTVPDMLSGSLDIAHNDVTITVNGIYQNTAEPLADIDLYLFNSSDVYQNRTQTTDLNGLAQFHLPSQAYKVRADYMGQHYFSKEFIDQDATIDIAMADAEIIVTGLGQPLSGQSVYVFSESGAYMNLTATTDENGKAVFRLPADRIYRFRADYQGAQYWSQETDLIADQINPIEISTGGGSFAFTVYDNDTLPLTGVTCYVFSESGVYLSMHAATNDQGQVMFDLPDGSYKIRIDYMGVQHWSTIYEIPAVLSGVFSIAHQDVTVSVNRLFQSTAEPLENVRVYLFSPTNAYQNQYRTTDADGQVNFHLPLQEFKVRADYLGGQYWSGTFTGQSTVVDIPTADADVQVAGFTTPIADVSVYVFSESGVYKNITGKTGADGHITFRLPADTAYTFRADYQGSQFWSHAQTLIAGQINSIDIQTGGGTFDLRVLNDSEQPLSGATCYVFRDTGVYMNITTTTDVNGQAQFNLSDGSYKFRVHYAGFIYWTPVYALPDQLSDDFIIPFHTVTVTVNGHYLTDNPMQSMPVYLFMENAATYLNQNAVTDATGQAGFTMPVQPITARISYLGQLYWSDIFTDTTIVTIDQGQADLHVTAAGADITDATIYLFSESSFYQNQYQITDTTGHAAFILPEGTFLFRVNHASGIVWSQPVTIVTGESVSVSIELNQ